MANIISIARALPEYCHKQSDIFYFMKDIYGLSADDTRKLKFLYDHSGIETRYSVVGDYGADVKQRNFIPSEKAADFPDLDQRMAVFDKEALTLSVKAIQKCIAGFVSEQEITHLITVSCTGMSAPGLDLQLMNEMKMMPNIFRTSVNFMGCYAAIHALKLSKMICDSTPDAKVVIVCTELCTLHFQKEFAEDNAASSLLFADGSAAVLVSDCLQSDNALSLRGFYSHVVQEGRSDMAWQLSSKGFLMTLSSYVPRIIGEDIRSLVKKVVAYHELAASDITHWCIHPGGKRILDVIEKQLELPGDALKYSREILRQYGNMSSPTVLFVLQDIMNSLGKAPARIMGMAFGPGLTMETFIAER